MHRHFYLSGLGDRHHPLQKVPEVFPLLLFGDDPVFGQGFMAQLLVIKAAHLSAGARRQLIGGPHDAENGHPHAAPHGNPQCSHISQQGADDVDFFIPSRQPQFDLLHGRPGFDHRQGESVLFVGLLCPLQGRIAPGLLILTGTRYGIQTDAADGVFHPALFHQSQIQIRLRGY